MTAKEYLRQYEYAALRAKRCREQYETALEKIDAIGSTLGTDGMPHGSGVSRKTEDLAIKLGEAAQRYLDAEENALIVKEEVESVINSLPESMEGVVLYERYINLAKWDDIADLLMYSISNVFRLHALGLNEVEAILNEGDNCRRKDIKQ